jgi:ABC-2 type transport system ATP-binding protein
VLLSSHILTEISQTCDRILVMGKGRIIADGTEDELRRKLVRGGVVDVTVRGDGSTVRGRLAGVSGVKAVEILTEGKAAEAGTVRLRVQAEGDVREALARKLVEGGFGLLALGNSEHELEDVFVELTRDRSQASA